MLSPSLPKIANLKTSENHNFTIVVGASFCQNTYHAGLGAICRNSTCQWVEGICSTMMSIDANMAELLASHQEGIVLD